jgi:hypothetical protein
MRRDLEKWLAKLMPARAEVVETFILVDAPTRAEFQAEQDRLEAAGVKGMFIHGANTDTVRSEIIKFPAGTLTMMLDEIDARARAERAQRLGRFPDRLNKRG